jgi:hypothetical protein
MKIAASRFPRLFPLRFRVGRDPASMQVTPSPRIPARRPGYGETPRRFSAGLASPQPALRPERGTGVESPLKSANRRPDDKVWTPWMAARGESRQDVELRRPQAEGREVSEVRSTDFVAGPRGLKRGPRWPPFPVHRLHTFIFCHSQGERNKPQYLSISDSYDSLHFRQGILKRNPMVSRWMQHVSNSGH